MVSPPSAALAGSAGREGAGADERTDSTARAGSGVREPFSGADTLRVGVVVDARWGGGTISTVWGLARAGAASGRGAGPISGRGAGLAVAVAGLGTGAGATTTGAAGAGSAALGAGRASGAGVPAVLLSCCVARTGRFAPSSTRSSTLRANRRPW